MSVGFVKLEREKEKKVSGKSRRDLWKILKSFSLLTHFFPDVIPSLISFSLQVDGPV